MSRDLGRIPIDLNWTPTSIGTNGYEFRADRTAQPSLVFKLVDAGVSYSVECYTETASKLRAREKACWRSGLAKADALKHLQDLFSEL